MSDTKRGPGDQEAQPGSAQVIVRSASGASLRGDVPITSANIAEYTPDPGDVAGLQGAFRSAGFEVGDLAGISFSITAPLAQFERYFGTRLRIDAEGAVARKGGRAPSGGLELPLDDLPREVRERIVAVAFSPPADLHGGEGGAMY